MAREQKLTGVEKAALLLMNIGEELASEVFKHMTPNEMKVVGSTIVRRETVSLQTGRQIVGELVDTMEKGEVAIEGLEFAKSVILKALGPEKGKSILDQLTRDMSTGSIESLRWMDPTIVANVIKSEHPQIIALILVHLDSDKAAQVLLNLPDERIRGDVMLRVATLKRIPQAAVRELESLLSEQMMTADSGIENTVEGVKAAAEILNQMESKIESSIMDMIEKASPDLAVKIQEKMFVFNDLLTIDDRGMQQIIKELSSDTLSIALKGAEDAIGEKFLRNMSERAAEMLKEDMESRGPIKLSEVEKSQQEIIKIARRLEQEGKIVRSGRDGDVVI